MTEQERTLLFMNASCTVGLKANYRKLYSQTIGGLQEYFNDAYGKKRSNFSGDEMLGAYGILPQFDMWPRLLLLRWIADLARDKKPVKIAHVWRPDEYNKSVGGAKKSSHIDCCAIDLDFQDAKDKDRAFELVKKIWDSPINLGMGIGIGKTCRLHIDVFSKQWEKVGKTRIWRY